MNHLKKVSDLLVALHIQRFQKSGLVWILIHALGHSQSILLFFVVRAVRQMRKTTDPSLMDDLLGDSPSDGAVVGNAQN